MLYSRQEYLDEVKSFLLDILRRNESRQWTRKEIIEVVDNRFGQETVGNVLNLLKQEKKIVIRRYSSNLFKYSLI